MNNLRDTRKVFALNAGKLLTMTLCKYNFFLISIRKSEKPEVDYFFREQ